MGKRTRNYLELDYNQPGALRAEDIPYSAVQSVKDAIDAIIIANETGVHKNGVDVGETLLIPSNHHLITCRNFYVDGDCIVDGDLIEV